MEELSKLNGICEFSKLFSGLRSLPISGNGLAVFYHAIAGATRVCAEVNFAGAIAGATRTADDIIVIHCSFDTHG